MSFLGSALTAPGTSAANADAKAKKLPQTIAKNRLNDIYPTLISQGQQVNALEPMRQRSVWDSINATSHWGVQQGVESARRGFMDANMSALPSIHQALSQGGAGIGAIQGANYAAINNANNQGNNLMAYWSSPQGRQALAQMSQQSIMQGQSMPALGLMERLSNIVYGRQAPQVGASPLAAIAGIGANLVGAGGFGGGGGQPAPANYGSGGNYIANMGHWF